MREQIRAPVFLRIFGQFAFDFIGVIVIITECVIYLCQRKIRQNFISQCFWLRVFSALKQNLSPPKIR